MNMKRNPFRFVGDKKFHLNTFITSLCLVLITGAVVLSINILVLSKHLELLDPLSQPALIHHMIVESFLSMLAILILTFFITKLTSHKVSGPMHRLKIEMERILEGDLKTPVKFRSDDEFKNLGDIFNRLRQQHLDHQNAIYGKMELFNNEIDVCVSGSDGNDVEKLKVHLLELQKKAKEIQNLLKP